MPAILGNKPKMLKKVLYSIIDPKCYSNFTWTGKAPNNKKKNAMQDYEKVLQLLYKVVKGSDSTYDYKLFLVHLKDKVIKYAYE